KVAIGLPQSPQGDGGRQDGRLGTIGTIQLGVRAVLAQLPQVVSQRIAGFGESLAHQPVLFGQAGQHADRLGTLSGEYESEGLSHATFLIVIERNRPLRMTSRSARSQ